MQKVHAKKYLGQHFLIDLSIAQKIVNSLSQMNSNVLEIGPGMGVLTQYLLKIENINLKLVEIDGESVEYLKENLNINEQNIYQLDFLKTDLNNLFNSQKFCVIGNFPYNISSQIFFKILDYKYSVTEIVCMLQREVAKRLASKPGNKDYGILSVFLQAFYDIEYLFTVDEQVFNPPPKVKSGVIRLKRNNVVSLSCDEKLFRIIVKTTFNQRRKTIWNSIRNIQFKHDNLRDHQFMKLRPEQLSVQDFVDLTNLVSANY